MQQQIIKYNLNRCKEFCKKNSTILICAISVIIFLLSRVWYPINWLAILPISLFSIFAKVTHVYSAFMFIYSFAGIFTVYVANNHLPMSPVVMVISALILLIRHIVLVIKKQQKLAIVPAIISIVLLAYSFLFFNISDYYRIMAAMMVLVLGYVTFIHNKELDFTKIVRYTVAGIIISTLIALILQCIPSQHYLIWHGNRFQSLSGYPNNLQIGCIATVTLLLVLKFKNKINLLEFLISAISIGVIGVFTLSKAYSLCLAIVLFVYMILILRKNKIHGLWQCISIIVIAGLVFVIFRKQFFALFERFTKVFTDSSVWNQITTGRVEIWSKFWQGWLSTPLSIIFGNGLTAPEPVLIGSHNDALYILYHLGIFGALLVVTLLISYFMLVRNKKQRVHLINFVPLLIILILSIEETILLKTEFIFIIFAMAFIFDKQEICKEQEQEMIGNTKEPKIKIKEKIEIICPLYNAEKYIIDLHNAIIKQENVNINKITYVLTEGNDNTEQIMDENKIPFTKITASEFSHSLTRERFAMASKSNVVVFITQDIKPTNNDWLYQLVNPIVTGECDASFSRQISLAKGIEKYTREKNYPQESYINTKADLENKGIKAFFYSDASSAVRTSLFKSLNGYDGKDMPTNEDMYLAYKLINNEYKIKYCADSMIYHSHDFTIRQMYKRYYAIGVFMANNSYLDNYGTTKAGGGLAKYILLRSLKEFNVRALLRFFPDMLARYFGMRKGKKDTNKLLRGTK